MTDSKDLQIASTDAKPAKTPRISARIRQAVELLVSGECKTQKAAAVRVGVHPDYLCRELKKDQVRVFCDRRVRETIASGSMRASARLIELLDAGSEHVSLDASKHMLAIGGIKPAETATTTVNVNIRAGYVIDLSEPGDMIDVTPNASEGNR